MAFRGNESPMDFQWEKHGPADPSSPFHKFAMANDKKRSHTTFTSTAKGNFPSLREPNGQPYFLSSRPQDAPTSPWKEPSFTTPRKNFDIDFSSGPESSPVVQTDGETPDGKASKPLPAVPGEKDKEKSKAKRNSLFNFYGKFAPGKGEIKKAASDPVTKRIYKKRRQAQTFERQLALKRRESEDTSDSEATEPQTPKQRKQKKNKDLPPLPQLPQAKPGFMANFFNFIHQYPDAPSTIAKYFQVIFNGVILSGALFVLYSFYATIRADIDKASDDAYQEALAETVACSKHFLDNRCSGASRLPALEVSCSKWEICMNRDPNAVRRASLSAHTFAMIIESFVEPISLKTMIFAIAGIGLLLLVNNATFTLYRRSQEEKNSHEGYRAASAQYGHPGAHMSHLGQFAMSPGLPYQTPSQWQVQGQGMSGQIEYDQSPSKYRGRSGSPEKKRLMMDHDRDE